MNLSTCPGCGDQHICAGRRRTTGPTLAEQIRHFVAEVFTTDTTGVVGTADTWAAYLTWCAHHGHVPFSQRRFVQAMAEHPGIRRIKRSTMRFAGIRWANQITRGRHAAPEGDSVLGAFRQLP